MPGAVARVVVAVGDRVARGPAAAVAGGDEDAAPDRRPGHGVVTELPVQVGQQVDVGAVLAVVDADGGQPAWPGNAMEEE